MDNDSERFNHNFALEAVLSGRPEMLRSALAQGASANSVDARGDTLIRKLAQKIPLRIETDNSEAIFALKKTRLNEYLECLDILIKAGADLERLGRDGQTDLQFVARRGRTEVVEALLDGGALVDAQSLGGMTAFHVAIAAQRQDLAQLFIERGADPSLPDFEGSTPLHTAVLGEYVELMAWLLELGASPTAMNGEGVTPWGLCVDLNAGSTPWASALREAFIKGEGMEMERSMTLPGPAPRRPSKTL